MRKGWGLGESERKSRTYSSCLEVVEDFGLDYLFAAGVELGADGFEEGGLYYAGFLEVCGDFAAEVVPGLWGLLVRVQKKSLSAPQSSSSLHPDVPPPV